MKAIITEVFEEIGNAVKNSSYFKGINIRWTIKEISPNNIAPLTMVLQERNLKITNLSCNEAEQIIDIMLLTTSPNIRDSYSKLALYREQMILLMNNITLKNAVIEFIVASEIGLIEFPREKSQNQKNNTVLSNVVGLAYKIEYNIGDNSEL